MKRHRDRLIAGVLALAVAPVAFAACGGSSSKTTTAVPASAESTTGTVSVASTRLGKILVDSTGRTLYLFKADSGTRSACSGACATAWPPLTTGAAPAGMGGANAALLGTISRSGGVRQVTYNGHPLYLFVEDHEPGDVNGQGVTAFGAAWFAVSPAGNQISSHAKGHSSGSSPSHAAPAAPPASKPQPAPKPTIQPAPAPAAKPAPPAAKPAPPANAIPQNNGGDGDSDNNGGPSDGDGNV
jgi:predicted lipoprotein with Yx(FWY)xxD motif